MDELCWINGSVMPLADAKVSVEDRGFVFADGVYEVFRIYAGQVFAMREHLSRLTRSLRGVEIELPWTSEQIAGAIGELVERSGVRDGIVYLQATRGPAPRGHVYPKSTQPTLFFFARAMTFTRCAKQRVVSVEDDRWKKCWIKSIALLPNILAKNAVTRAGADEGIYVDAGQVQEGTTCNVGIIVGDALITPPTGAKVLPGVTRELLLPVARSLGMEVIERTFSLEEAYGADEAILISTTREVAWIGEWDGSGIGSGRCGPWTHRLNEAFSAITPAGRA